MVIGIIGGGASGMAAALAAAECENVQVVLFERQARVGRKLQATGNGRCNLTNLHAREGGYHGNEPAFAVPALERFDVVDTLCWFRKLGLVTVAEDSGRVYPYSDQANSVVDVLRLGLMKENITLYEGIYPTEIYGEMRVTGIKISNKVDTDLDIPVAAVFTALGQTRDNAIFARVVVVDDSGYIIAAEDCATDTKGVWAAGDTRTKPLRQIVTAASDGATAATAASAYIIKKRKK